MALGNENFAASRVELIEDIVDLIDLEAVVLSSKRPTVAQIIALSTLREAYPLLSDRLREEMRIGTFSKNQLILYGIKVLDDSVELDQDRAREMEGDFSEIGEDPS